MRKMILFPFLTFLLFSCGGENAFVEDIDELYEEKTKVVYDTICRTETDSEGNEVTDTIITERTETVRNDLKITIDSICYKFVIEGPGSMQGADCYNNLVFQFCNGFNYASCYDITNGNKIAMFKFAGAPSGLNYHCNNADFSQTFFSDDDEFPLIYVSQSSPRHVVVGRIARKKNTFTMDVVQTIVLSGIPSADVVIDKENGYMYAYVYNMDKLILYKYKIPEYNLSDRIVLTKDDILETIDIGHVTYRQGATIKDGFLYMLDGVPNWGTEVYLKVVNLENGSYSRISLSHNFGFYYEAEDVFFYNNDLFLVTNFNKGVYKVCMSFNK